MDKTNVTIKMQGKLLPEAVNLIDIDEDQLVQKLIELLQSRKNLVNISFQSGEVTGKKSVSTITKIEILLSDENGAYNYYED